MVRQCPSSRTPSTLSTFLRVGGCPAVVAQWQSIGGSSQRCLGFDSWRLPAFFHFALFSSHNIQIPLSHANKITTNILWCCYRFFPVFVTPWCHHIMCKIIPGLSSNFSPKLQDKTRDGKLGLEAKTWLNSNGFKLDWFTCRVHSQLHWE